MTVVSHVVTQPPKVFVIGDGRIEVHQLRAWQDNYIWVLYSRSERQAVIIDGPTAAPLDSWLTKHPCDTISIWNTHHHPDHVGINRELIDRNNPFKLTIIGCASRESDIPGFTYGVDEGDVLTFCEQDFIVWRTEGHVDGHLCFVHSDVVFCGDTLATS